MADDVKKRVRVGEIVKWMGGHFVGEVQERTEFKDGSVELVLWPLSCMGRGKDDPMILRVRERDVVWACGAAEAAEAGSLVKPVEPEMRWPVCPPSPPSPRLTPEMEGFFRLFMHGGTAEEAAVQACMVIAAHQKAGG